MSTKEVILEAQRDKKKVHFATSLDICHLKHAELKPKFQKYSGRVVFRGDIVKDDSGFYAEFTDQGSSASQMTAPKRPEGWGPQGMSRTSGSKTGGGRPARVPNLRVCKHSLLFGWHTQGRKGELTSCRGTL